MLCDWFIGPESREVSRLFGINTRTRHKRRSKSSTVSFTFPNSIATSMLEAGVLFIVHFYCLLGKIVDGREIMVQFAKYGPNAERM